MRAFSSKDAPIGLAILLGILSWIGSQLYLEVRDSLVISTAMAERSENGTRLVSFSVTNESVNRAVAPLNFSLKCPSGLECFTKTLLSPSGVAQKERVAPWDMEPNFETSSRTVDVSLASLPPGATLKVLVSIPTTGILPLFFYTVDDASVPVPRMLPASNPLVFVARHYLELLIMALVATLSLIVWWMFAPE